MKLIKHKNAVLINELRMLSKSRKTAVQIMVLDLVLVISSIIFMLTINLNFYNAYTFEPESFIYFFLVITVIEGLIAGFVVPSITSGSISGERERQTLDVLLMTDMTPWEITVGKYLASVMHVIFLMVSTLPVMALVFVYGNIPLWTLFVIFFTLLVTVLLLASFAVFFSASAKKTSAAGVLSYLTMFILIIGTLGLSGISYAVIEGVNAVIYETAKEAALASGAVNVLPATETIDPILAALPLLLNPGITVFDSFIRFIGIDGYTDGVIYFISHEMFSAYHGSSTGLSLTDVLDIIWIPLSIVLQLLVSFLMVKAASKALVRQPKNRKKKKH